MPYEVRIAGKPRKFLGNLQQDYRETIKALVTELKTNPFPRGSLQLSGQDNCYRLRIGPFRIQYYTLEKQKSILVYKISRRDDSTYR